MHFQDTTIVRLRFDMEGRRHSVMTTYLTSQHVGDQSPLTRHVFICVVTRVQCSALAQLDNKSVKD